jgi:hypothetical protein
MRILVHIKKVYDWEPVPADVKVTPADIAAERVKPSASGGWLMKVTKNFATETQVNLSEEQVIAKIIHDKTRPEGGRVLTRKQAIAFYLSENVMPHHAHRSWITSIEVDDLGAPDEPLMRKMLAYHTVSEAARVSACKAAATHATLANGTRCPMCGYTSGADVVDTPNIEPADVEAHIAAYKEPLDTNALVTHLHGHFKVKAVTR